MATKKRNMPNMAYSTGKPYGHNAPMADAYGQILHEGEQVFLLGSSVKKSRYIVDEIDGHIAYLRPIADTRVSPFPVLSGQIVKATGRQARA